MSDLENSNVDNNDNNQRTCCCCCFSKKPRRGLREITNMNGLSEAPEEKMPFKYDLPKAKPIGTTICVKGRTLPNCSRFSINFTCDNNKTTSTTDLSDSDIALHFNPRLQQRYVVRNYRLKGRWGDEDTLSIAAYKLKTNEDFNIQFFIASSNEILISIDNVHFCSYKIKFQLEQITTIVINGPVEVDGVEIKKLQLYPDPKATKSRVLKIPTREEFVKTVLSTPVTFQLPEGLQQNWQLEIVGRVKILPHSFYINLQEGSQYWPHPNIPLHLNPRFSVGQHQLIRNAWLNGKWGPEERTSSCHFLPGSHFKLSIRLGDNHFSVWVNDKLIGEFKFRSNINNIDTVYIHGDVIIHGVLIDKNP